MKNTKIKKLLAAVTVCAMLCALLAGCGAKTEAPAAPEAPAAENTAAAMPNPMTEITAEEFVIPVNIPENAGDVKYFTLNDGSSELVYQMNYTAGGHEYVFRAQPTSVTEAYDMSGLYYDNWNTESAAVAYCSAAVMTNTEAAAIYWLDVVPGINYTLSCSAAVSAEEITAAANEVFASAQGDAEGDTAETVSAEAEQVYDYIPLNCIEGAENPVFSCKNGMSLMEFDYGGVHFEYRAERTSELTAYDMSGIESDEWRSGTFTVAYCEAFAKDNDNCNVIYWLDVVPGINYTLNCDYDFAIEEMLRIANDIFHTTQGDAEESIPNFTGTYSDGNYNDVRLIAVGDGTYYMEIGIYRLTTFDAKGSNADGNVEFAVIDPAGGNITGTFCRAEDGESWTLTFVSSDWDLLESGTEFTGFTLTLG